MRFNVKSVVGLCLAFVLGVLSAASITDANAAGKKDRSNKPVIAFDKDGARIQVGDVVVDEFGKVYRIHGFASYYEAGTEASYTNKVQKCEGCSVPSETGTPAERELLLEAQGDTIVWGT